MARTKNIPHRDEAELADNIREQLSPQAVAAIVGYLQPARTNDQQVNRQIRWFSDLLVELVGGPDECDRLSDELGL